MTRGVDRKGRLSDKESSYRCYGMQYIAFLAYMLGNGNYKKDQQRTRPYLGHWKSRTCFKRKCFFLFLKGNSIRGLSGWI